MSIYVDGEKLAYGLEDGMVSSEESFFKGFRLGYANCAIASTAVKLFMQDMGFSSDLVVSSFNSPHGPMDHVMPRVHDGSDDPIIIDPTWVQFLRYAGWDEAYDIMTGRQILPREVLVFRQRESTKAVKHVARVALEFMSIEQDLVNEVIPADIDGERIHQAHRILPDNESEIMQFFGPIWDPKNFSPFEPTTEMVDEGRKIIQNISGTIVRVGL